MPVLEIDNKKITVESGTTVLEAAHANGIEIPHFCYHPEFASGGLCRMCLVEIEKVPKLQTACTTVVREGMIVKTTTPRVKTAREAVLEFILTNHPLDCPDCDQAGECVLQEFAHEYGPDKSAFTEPKQLLERIQLSELIAYDPERCIVCERCVRYYRDIVGTEELTVMQRGAHSEIATFPGKQLGYGYVGNIADLCPVGALTTKDFRFKERVYNLRTTETICPLCEENCPIYVDAKDTTVYRVRARNPKIESIHLHPNRDVTAMYPEIFVNAILRSSFICDDGRFGYKKLAAGELITAPLNRADPENSEWEDITEFVSQSIKKAGSKIVGIISPFATNEEAYLFLYLIKRIAGSETIALMEFQEAKEYGNAAKLKLRKGRQAPNAGGVKRIAEAFGLKVIDVKDALSVKPEMVYILGPSFDRMNAHSERLDSVDCVVIQDFKASTIANKAHIVLPGMNFMQKDGTYTNRNGKVQRIRKAVRTLSNAKDDLEILNNIIYRITGESHGSFDQVLRTIIKDIPFFRNADYTALTEGFHFKKAAGRLW